MNGEQLLLSYLQQTISPASNVSSLKERIIQALQTQGFETGDHLRPAENSKETYRRLQQQAKLEQLALHKKFLINAIEKVKNYCRNGNEIVPERIFLELREIRPGTREATLFYWWNLIWWSMPHQPAYGRQMRFLLWDVTHDAPFGLICLHSPVLCMAVRDRWLGIPSDELNIWINMSMSAHRVGALPPYNALLGGKMVALALTCNEIREAYRRKYDNTTSLMRGRRLKADLLFITTTSAFGKSSLYNRLKYKDEIVAQSLGYTRGSGTFHIPDGLYRELLKFLESQGVDTSRRYGDGRSKKLKLISVGLRRLGLSGYEFHGVKREFFLFPLVKNLKAVIQKKEDPVWIDRPFNDLVDYWRTRWAIPRAQRTEEWRQFCSADFLKQTEQLLVEL